MYFCACFKGASQDILGYVAQEATLEDAEKDAKSELLAFMDRFRITSKFFRLFYTNQLIMTMGFEEGALNRVHRLDNPSLEKRGTQGRQSWLHCLRRALEVAKKRE